MKKQPAKKTAGDNDIKKLFDAHNKDMKRYVGALSEEFQGRVAAVAEQFLGLNEKLDLHTEMLGAHSKKLDLHTEMIGGMKEDIEVIKSDIADIKADVRKRVTYDEFQLLVNRVILLEKRAHRGG